MTPLPIAHNHALACCASGCGWRECRKHKGLWLCILRCYRHRKHLWPVLVRLMEVKGC
jgi:hypothetical protein